MNGTPKKADSCSSPSTGDRKCLQQKELGAEQVRAGSIIKLPEEKEFRFHSNCSLLQSVFFVNIEFRLTKSFRFMLHRYHPIRFSILAGQSSLIFY